MERRSAPAAGPERSEQLRRGGLDMVMIGRREGVEVSGEPTLALDIWKTRPAAHWYVLIEGGVMLGSLALAPPGKPPKQPQKPSR
jgi:hypothetical protein